LKIDENIGVVGLGYVGLTFGTVLAEAGFQVLGIEKRSEIVESTNNGKPHFSETGLEDALRRVVRSGSLKAASSFNPSDKCSCYVITVGTPLDEEGLARLDMIEQATRQVAENMPEGALVILRSTVKIGTARKIVAPILKDSGKLFYLAMCPERTLEGKALQELRQLPQIVGADDQAVRDRASAIFQKLTKSIVQVSTLEAAEIVKLVDNTYRDVQFAFANEVARICESFDVNAHEVIESGKLGYERTNVPMPGLVGGPCLEKDPHILDQSAKSVGLDLIMTRAGRRVNEFQPSETMEFIVSEMARRDMGGGSKVALLGLAFKGIPATDDMRGSMSLRVLQALRRLRPDTNIWVFDPMIGFETLSAHVPGVSCADALDSAIRDASVVIIANNHPVLAKYPPATLCEMMAADGFIYDYWNHFSNLGETELGDSYFAVGNTRRSRR